MCVRVCVLYVEQSIYIYGYGNETCKERKRKRGKESNSNLVYLLKNIIYKIIEIFCFTS